MSGYSPTQTNMFPNNHLRWISTFALSLSLSIRFIVFSFLTERLYPESVIRLPFLFRAAVSQIVSCFIEDVAGYIEKKQDTR